MYPNFNYIKRHFLFLANKTDKAMDAKLYNVSFNQHFFPLHPWKLFQKSIHQEP